MEGAAENLRADLSLCHLSVLGAGGICELPSLSLLAGDVESL